MVLAWGVYLIASEGWRVRAIGLCGVFAGGALGTLPQGGFRKGQLSGWLKATQSAVLSAVLGCCYKGCGNATVSKSHLCICKHPGAVPAENFIFKMILFVTMDVCELERWLSS